MSEWSWENDFPTVWYISSHYVSGKENKQNQQQHPKSILSLDLLLSLFTNSVINVLKYIPFCLHISIIDMQMETNTQRQNPWRNFPQTTHSAPSSRKCARNTLYPSHDFFMTLYHALNIWIPSEDTHYHGYPTYLALLLYAVLLTHRDLATLSSVTFWPIKI